MGQIYSIPAHFCRASTECSVVCDENGKTAEDTISPF